MTHQATNSTTMQATGCVCLLCGIWVSPTTERRYRHLQEIAELVHRLCTPTSMVYKVVLENAEKERAMHRVQGICGYCNNRVEPHTNPPNESDTNLDICWSGRKQALCTCCINWVRRLSRKLTTVNRVATWW